MFYSVPNSSIRGNEKDANLHYSQLSPLSHCLTYAEACRNGGASSSMIKTKTCLCSLYPQTSLVLVILDPLYKYIATYTCIPCYTYVIVQNLNLNVPK